MMGSWMKSPIQAAERAVQELAKGADVDVVVGARTSAFPSSVCACVTNENSRSLHV